MKMKSTFLSLLMMLTPLVPTVKSFGATWSIPQIISSPGAYCEECRIALNNNDIAVANFMQLDGSNDRIRAALLS